MVAQLTAYPAMIIAPAHLMRNWQSRDRPSACHADGKPIDVHIVWRLKTLRPSRRIFTLMHYLLLRGWKEALPDDAAANGDL